MLGNPDALTRGRLLAGNVALNAAGWLLPAFAALIAYPRLLHAMGTERFGLLALAWGIVGYFSVLDLGIARALTQALAERAARGDESESPGLTWTGLWLLAIIGVACAAALAAAAPWITVRVLTVPAGLHGEVVAALRLLAAAVPWLVVTAGFRAVLEAGQRFGMVNALRVPLGLATFAGPMAVQPFSHGLPAAIAVLVGARVVMCALHAWAVVREYPALRRVSAPRRAQASRLWSVAGWLTVSGVVSPVLVSADRFVVGAVLPIAAVAYYSTASEVATKMWLFTAALQPVLFPALAASLVRSPSAAAALFDRAVRATIAVLAPAALLLVLFGRDAVALWLGPDVARAAGPALQWLSVAVFVNSVAQVPYAAVQGGGRADVAAKLHLVELPLYGAVLWWLAHRYGLLGVALAWLARMVGDGFVLLWTTGRALAPLAVPARRAALATFSVAVALSLCTLPVSFAARVATAVAGLAALVAAVPLGLVTAEERAIGAAWLAARRASTNASDAAAAANQAAT